MKDKITITKQDARRLFLFCQGLNKPLKLAKGKEGAAQVIERLGYVQIDTISVVERAHHHTIWTRYPLYEPTMLDVLQKDDKRVFEYWGNCASIIPMQNYRFYLPRMHLYERSIRTRTFLNANKPLVNNILSRIKSEGPLGSSDFESDGWKKSGWWNWKPAKRALEELFNTGKLMVSHRINFERKYDLPSRVIPAKINTCEPTQLEAKLFFLQQNLKAFGLLSEKKDAERVILIEDLKENKSVVEFHIQGLESENTYIALRSLFELVLNKEERTKNMLYVFSPFDNAVISRDRLRKFFNFNYKLEAYFPKDKRKYGYFCLPVLWGSDFIGRIDAKADRSLRTLIIRNIYLEPAFKEYDSVVGILSSKLREFCSFNDCDKVKIEKSSPVALKNLLELHR